MGIDKADVRTVINTALPASDRGLLPGDRARRPRRRTLPHRPPPLLPPTARCTTSSSSATTPPPQNSRASPPSSRPIFNNQKTLTRRLRMDPDIVREIPRQTSLAGCRRLRRRRQCPLHRQRELAYSGYDAQLNFRRQQIERMAAFAETQQCRMTALHPAFRRHRRRPPPLRPLRLSAPPNPPPRKSSANPHSQEQRHLRTILRALEVERPLHRENSSTDLALPAPYGKDRKALRQPP